VIKLRKNLAQILDPIIFIIHRQILCCHPNRIYKFEGPVRVKITILNDKIKSPSKISRTRMLVVEILRVVNKIVSIAITPSPESLMNKIDIRDVKQDEGSEQIGVAGMIRIGMGQMLFGWFSRIDVHS
jgi:hypothetical protein